MKTMTPPQIQVVFRGVTYNSLEEGFKGWARELNKDWDAAAAVLRKELKVFLTDVARQLAAKHSGAYHSGGRSKELAKRTGNSIASILNSVKVSGARYNVMKGTISGDYPLAIHEYGGTIRSRGKLLTIPLPPALDASGVPLKRSAGDWENTFIGRSHNGNLLIFQRRGASIIPLYVLVDRVEIQPRLGMRKAINAGIPHFVSRAMDAMVNSIMH